MLQPRTYPELVGKALVLEADPFLTMIEDNNPWVEGLFLVTSVGLLVGAAHLSGGLLTTAILPESAAMREAFMQAAGQLLSRVAPASDLSALEDAMRSGWNWLASYAGYQGGLARLFFALWPPLAFILQWLLVGIVGHVAARILGGEGTLVQTLGATALAVAPQILGVLTIIPFVSVSGLLLSVWGLLIAYRAVAISHELPWQRAALAVLVVPLLLLGLALAGVALVGVVAWGGTL